MQLNPRNHEQGFTLIELVIVMTILVVVLVIVGNFLVSANNAVADGTARANDDSIANTVMARVEANVRYASNISTSADGLTLYVGAGQPCVTTTWAYTANNTLTEQVGGNTSVVAYGVYLPPSGQVFVGSGTAGAYQGLVTVSFNVNLQPGAERDQGGVTVIQTLSAQNMAGPVGNTSGAVC